MGGGGTLNVENVQNTVVLRQVIMSKHCILSYALLRYCVFLLGSVPFHVKVEKVFLWREGQELQEGYFSQPNIKLGSHSNAEGIEIIPTRWTSLLSHLLSSRANVLPARRKGEDAMISAEPSY